MRECNIFTIWQSGLQIEHKLHIDLMYIIASLVCTASDSISRMMVVMVFGLGYCIATLITIALRCRIGVALL